MVRVKPRPKAIVLDIDGTTTSVRFLAEKLLPFIRSNIKDYLKERWNKLELRDTIDSLRIQTALDIAKDLPTPPILDNDEDDNAIRRSVVVNVLFQMNEKRSNKPLINIQLLIWNYGYETEKLKGHVFPDVPDSLDKWKNKDNIRVYLYSSGIISVQKLLFSCSEYGDLSSLIDGYFDTESNGPKSNEVSFESLIRQLKLNGPDLLYLTDNPKEAVAATRAKCRCILVSRPGNKPLSDEAKERYTVIRKFDEIVF